ncbi:radical SAM family heme chaperone HemW [Streptobacillus ratti]|uniref:radical SAM family heme chaperone HemW n=1 Tax=Streptobacillus ratti TaxID=1720557 RepID=UPI00093483AF|nr:radical SAM family heme chaperone HemW [Streptobacillus ratti]
MKNITGIYIHVPFCNKRCHYCDFHVFINMNDKIERYVEYLIKEIKLYPEYTFDTIYFGGGTPSLLNGEQIKKILDNLKKTDDAEITLELNPSDMDLEKLKYIKNAGINRLSIGFQSFNDDMLKFMNRDHSSKKAIETYRNARIAGFDNISLDLIFSVPNQDMEMLENDLDKFLELSPEHLSIYSLIWEEGTNFTKRLEKGELKALDEDLEADMFLKIQERLIGNGYNHYEISSFCKNGRESKHNIKYWDNTEYIGIGVNATSFYNQKRFAKVKSLARYYRLIDQDIIPIDEKSIEIVDEVELENLKYILGLRMLIKGVKYTPNDKIDKLIEKGLIEKFDDRIKLTSKGVLLSNEVFVEFV